MVQTWRIRGAWLCVRGGVQCSWGAGDRLLGEAGAITDLRLSLLGGFRLTLEGKPAVEFKSNKVRALLAYLAVESDRPHSREKLAGLLWPDWPDRAAVGNLRFTLSSLRRAIGEARAKPPILLISRDSLQFNTASDHWVDATVFTRLTRADRSDPGAVQQLEEAVGLYHGSFLEGFSVSDSAAFEDWMVHTREELAREMIGALQFLTSAYERRGEYEHAQLHARRQLDLEPWDEAAHQQLMRALALGGQRSAALAQYQTCRRLLAEELKVEPSEETTKLFEHIRDGKLKPAAPALDVQRHPVSQPPGLLAETGGPEPEPAAFVARERELQQLDRLLGLALSGEGRVAFVTGEAGSGKSALLHAFARQAANAHPELVAVCGNCSAYTGIGDPYLPFREMLELLTGGIEAGGDAGTVTRQMARRLWEMVPSASGILLQDGPDLIDTFLSRASLLRRAQANAPPGADWVTSLEEVLERKPARSFGYPVAQQIDLFEQYTKVLKAIAHARPLLLLVDDLQWADPGSISLLFHLGRHLAGSRILILGAYRPEEVALEKDGGRHPLEGLVNEFCQAFGDIMVNVDFTEDRAFVDAYLDTEPNRLGESFRKMLCRQTHGHPLFTIELLRGLQERGDLIHDAEGCWIEGPSLNWETLPVRVEAAIRERIRRMPEPLRRALTVASVEGEEFTAEVVARVRAADEETVLEHLSGELDRKHRLVRAHSVQRLHDKALSRFQFRHILFQKYLYGTLDQVERAHLHAQVGATLEGLYGADDEAAAIALQLARHFQEAGATDKVIHYLQRAGDAAVRLSAYEEGVAHLNRALALLNTRPDTPERAPAELTLQLSMGKACMADIMGPRWQGAISRARALCKQTGNAAELSQVLGEQASFHYVRAEFQKALETGEESLALAQESGDAVLVALGHWRLGYIRFGMGEFLASRAHLGEVLAFYKPQLHHESFVRLHGSDAGLSSMTYEACCLWCLGYPDQALKLGEEAIAMGREFGHGFSLADVLCYGGCLLSKMRRDAPALRRYADELLQLSKGMGVVSFSGSGTCHRGDALAQLGNFDEGIAELEAGFAVRRARTSLCTLSAMFGGLAEAQALAGHPEAGLSTLAEAFAFVESTGERHWEAELYRLRAELLLAQGNETEAEASLCRAVEVSRGQQAKSWELRAAISLCRLWSKQGKQAQARQRLSEIYDWFTEGFDTPDLTEARELLGELSR